MKNKIVISILFFTMLLTLSGCGCKSNNAGQAAIELEIWGPIDDSFTYKDVFEAYQKLYPNVKDIRYRRFSPDTYEKELVDALASGQGPDIFLIHNTWLPSFKDKIIPAPAEIINEQRFRSNFVDVVVADFLDQGKVWASPLSVDSLGLYYNKDLFNEAGISTPPKNWDEFGKDARLLTKFSTSHEIIQSGAAFGAAYNINRSTDVLNLLMMQSGTQTNDKGVLDLRTSKVTGGSNYSPAEDALSFYTQFAQATSPYYSWNSRMHYSIDAFSEGTLAMMFNYSWHIQTIKDKSPKLNFAVASVPQFAGSSPMNFANYWGFAVAKNKQTAEGVTNETRISESWKLINFLTTKPEGQFAAANGGMLGSGAIDSNYDPAKEYLEKTRKPAARRDLIETQKTDAELGVFAKDNLIAKSWKEVQPDAIESILAEMIDQVNKGQANVTDAIETASQRIGKLSSEE
ncbi:MAG: extracellular solute-binding protein [Parcubacteria group bacterium]|jgi:multiple sugar transport system substrate-binding protein